MAERSAEPLPILAFPDGAAWRAWLDEHHADSPGVRVKMAKVASGIPSVRYPEVLDVALCFGWIDGQRDRLDDEWFLQRFTPRQRRSKWSKINCDKAVALIETGLMAPAGLREVERAKADGRWDAAYAGPATATVPDDLRVALDADEAAAAAFAGLNSQNRYSILFRVADAKRPETRAKRIAAFVAMLSRGEKLYP